MYRNEIEVTDSIIFDSGLFNEFMELPNKNMIYHLVFSNFEDHFGRYYGRSDDSIDKKGISTFIMKSYLSAWRSVKKNGLKPGYCDEPNAENYLALRIALYQLGVSQVKHDISYADLCNIYRKMEMKGSTAKYISGDSAGLIGEYIDGGRKMCKKCGMRKK
jgi:hypothetical protein